MTRRGLVVGAAALLVIFCVWLVRELRRPVEDPPPAQAEQWITPRGPALPAHAGEVLSSPSPRVAPLHAPPSRPGLPATMRLLPAQGDKHAAPLPAAS